MVSFIISEYNLRYLKKRLSGDGLNTRNRLRRWNYGCSYGRSWGWSWWSNWGSGWRYRYSCLL